MTSYAIIAGVVLLLTGTRLMLWPRRSRLRMGRVVAERIAEIRGGSDAAA